RKVLDGSFGSATFQVGANVGETIGIELNTSMRTSAIGRLAVGESGSTSGLFDSVTLEAGDFTIGGQDVIGTFYSVEELAAAIEAVAPAEAVVTVVGGQIDIAADGGNVVIAGDLADTLGLSGTINDGNNDTSAGAGDLFDGLTLDTGDFTLAVGDGDTVDLAGTYVTGQDLVDAINSKVSGATAVMQSDGTISIYSTDNLTIGGAEANATLGFTAATLV